MKKFDSIMLKIFLYGLPAFVLFSIFAYCYREGIVERGAGYTGYLNSLAGLIITVWMIPCLYLGLRLMFSASLRDQVIARITFIRERDERESFLTGRATRTTFLTSLAILIFFLFLSCLQVSVYRVPPDQAPEQATDGKTGRVSLGIGFSVLKPSGHDQIKDSQRQYLFDYRGLPISTEAFILMLIAWQIGFYNYSMRRLVR